MHLSCAPRVLRVIVRLHLSDAILRSIFITTKRSRSPTNRQSV
jgi:hypothetical protein